MADQKLHRMIVVDGLNLGKNYLLQDMHCTIGRANDNVIVVNSPSVSRNHARIVLTLNGPQAEDLNSTNGTFVNGDEITRPVTLRPGDMLMLADAMTLRYQVDEAEDDATEHIGMGSYSPATLIESPATPEDPFSEPAYAPPAMEYTPPPPVQQSPAYEEVSFGDPSPVYVPPEGMPAPVDNSLAAGTETRKRPRWVYIVIALLVIIICLCVLVAVYLWFAPIEFWEWLFNLVGLELPNAILF